MDASRIVVDPRVHHGKPVVRGTRVPADIVLGSLAGGMTTQEVAAEYGLAVEDVLAVLAYATKLVASEEISLSHA